MVVYRLKLEKSSDGAVQLRLGLGWRIFFVVSTAVLVAMIAHDGAARGLVPILTAISLFAAIYNESWRFDSSLDQVTSRVGVFFFFRTRTFRLSTLDRIRVRERALKDPDTDLRRSGRPRIGGGRGYVQLLLEFPEERPVVQTESIRNREHVHELARRLAEVLQVPLETG